MFAYRDRSITDYMSSSNRVCINKYVHDSMHHYSDQKVGLKSIRKNLSSSYPNFGLKKKDSILLIDLDVLIYLTTDPNIFFDFSIFCYVIDSIAPTYVIKRPNLDDFLADISTKAHVFIVTSLDKLDTEQLKKQLDPFGTVITKFIYKSSHVDIEQCIKKELDNLNLDYKGSHFLTHSDDETLGAAERKVFIPKFNGSARDRELIKLREYLDIIIMTDNQCRNLL